MRIIKALGFYLLISISFLSGLYVTTSITSVAKPVQAVVANRVLPAESTKQLPQFSLPERINETNSLLLEDLLLSRQKKTVQPTTAPTVLTSQPTAVNYSNQIIYPQVGLNVSFLHSVLSDFYEEENGVINYKKPKSTSDKSSNIQQLMNQGPVHVSFTASPGSVGNAYFVAHNYLHFSPIQEKGNVNDVITIVNNGTEMKFKIFETRYINKYDTSTAYYGYPGKSMITLQTCTSNPDNMWIIRAELV